MVPQTTHLREQQSAPLRNADIIDAKFEIVSGKKRRRLRAVLVFLFAAALAAAFGFMLPLVWIGVENLLAMFG
jgi:hypothetical protein